MRILFIGGTGNISGAVSRCAVSRGMDLTILNRGNRKTPDGARQILCNIGDEKVVAEHLRGQHYDCVVNWIAFSPEDIERDIRLFSGKTDQYVFISSASVYQKPPLNPWITEETPRENPYWEYSRNKIACEEILERVSRNQGFPAVIIRPSLTYDTLFPVAMGGWGCWTLADRMRSGREIVVHGDGTSLWTVTHADDFAAGLIPLLGNPDIRGYSFHITSDEILTWNQIYQTMADALGTVPRIIHMPSDFIVSVFPDMTGTLLGDKAHSLLFDNSRIKQWVPDFQARIPFRDGVRRTVDWFEADAARRIVNEREHEMLDTLISRFNRGLSPSGE